MQSDSKWSRTSYIRIYITTDEGIHITKVGTLLLCCVGEDSVLEFHAPVCLPINSRGYRNHCPSISCYQLRKTNHLANLSRRR